MPAHRVYLDRLRSLAPRPGDCLTIDGDEARHALRVKRLRAGEPIDLLDGAGLLVRAELLPTPTLAEPAKPNRHHDPICHVRVNEVVEVPRVKPALHVYTAVPKPGRLDDMIDALSQIGAASWSPLRTERIVTDPHDLKVHRLERIIAEACKQCGRAWRMEVGKARTIAEVGALTGSRLIADASGEAIGSAVGAGESDAVHLLIGPEGGWTQAELGAARADGCLVVRFGPHVMRIETAAVVAAGVIMGASSGAA